MRMYFHASTEDDYVLFEQWVPTTWAGYFTTLLAIMCIGIGHYALKVGRILFERYCAGRFNTNPKSEAYAAGIELNELNHRSHDDDTEDTVTLNTPRVTPEWRKYSIWPLLRVPFSWKVDLPRAILVSLELGVGLSLMLVAMTFNIGYFIAICCGGLVGSLLFGRYLV